MLESLTKFAETVHKRLSAFQLREPSAEVVAALIETAYVASLKTEEGRFIRGSLTFASRASAARDRPFLERAHFPSLTKLGEKLPLTVENLVKLARAVDSWAGSIVVWGESPETLYIWAIADQLVQRNLRIHREGSGGFRQPGLLTLSIDGVGQLSAFHYDYFLAAISGQALGLNESAALKSPLVAARIKPHYQQFAHAIGVALNAEGNGDEFATALFNEWSDVVSRLCIGLRRFGTGGAFIITPAPVEGALSIGYPFQYPRLRDSLILSVLDRRYARDLEHRSWGDDADGEPMDKDLHRELSFAQTDVEDRERELTGAAKLVSSLAALDGAVVLDATLGVVGFGAKIGNGPVVRTVLDGRDHAKRGAKASRVDLAGFGTRHLSMLRYCRLDPQALGVVVSQDGQVRMMMTHGKSLLLWSRVKLLGHYAFTKKAVETEIARQERQASRRARRLRGYSSMPKTIAELRRKTLSD